MYRAYREKLIERLVELKLAEGNSTCLWSLEYLSWGKVETLCCGYLRATERFGAVGDTYKARFETLVMQFREV